MKEDNYLTSLRKSYMGPWKTSLKNLFILYIFTVVTLSFLDLAIGSTPNITKNMLHGLAGISTVFLIALWVKKKYYKSSN